jgi:hypothetical protein
MLSKAKTKNQEPRTKDQELSVYSHFSAPAD